MVPEIGIRARLLTARDTTHNCRNTNKTMKVYKQNQENNYRLQNKEVKVPEQK